MPSSWVVTGASRGLGLAFVLHLSNQYPDDTIIGLVRNKSSITQASPEQLDLKNLHFIEADISDSSAANKAAERVASITGGSLDVLINNAAYNSLTTRPNKPSTFLENPDLLKREMETSVATNVLGTMYITNCLIPLLKKGNLKRLITISSANGERDAVKDCNIAHNITYASTKAMMAHIMLMYSIELITEGIVVLAISPGWVNTSGKELTEEDYKKFKPAIDNFMSVYPWDGRILEPLESVKMVLDVIEKSTLKDTGNVVSHHGDRDWL